MKKSKKKIKKPTNLEECFQALNVLLKQEDIEEIRNLPSKSKVIKYHFGIGGWMRNNWGLWKGSILQKYLLERGVGHPDSMSDTILNFYHDWLNDRHEEWKEFDKTIL